MKQDENSIVKNYKRWDKKKLKSEHEDLEKQIKILSEPPPKKNFVKIEKMLST